MCEGIKKSPRAVNGQIPYDTNGTRVPINSVLSISHMQRHLTVHTLPVHPCDLFLRKAKEFHPTPLAQPDFAELYVGYSNGKGSIFRLGKEAWRISKSM